MRCVECGFDRLFAPHRTTYEECERLMRAEGLFCLGPSEHHRYRPDWRGWLRDLWWDLLDLVRR